MTNADKYLRDGADAREFREKLSQFIFEELGFYDGTEESIDEVIGDFLDTIEKPMLTDDERVILRNIDPRYSFQTISREWGNLLLRGHYETDTEKVDTISDFDVYNHLFHFVKERRRI